MLWSAGFIAASGSFCFLFIVKLISAFDSSKGGNGIGDWIAIAIYGIFFLLFGISAFLTLRSFIKNTEYNEMLRSVQEIGDPEEIGNILACLGKCRYVRGAEVRYNSRVFFYMKGTDIVVLSPISIKRVRTDSGNAVSGADDSVCVSTGNEVIKLKTGRQNTTLLIKEMKQAFGLD